MRYFNRFFTITYIIIAALSYSGAARAFNGFLLSSTQQKISNDDSVVIFSRYENRTIVTLLTDYSYEGDKFAVLLPVPYLVSHSQIRIAPDSNAVSKVLKHTAPRFLRYEDQDACTQKAESVSKLKNTQFFERQLADDVGHDYNISVIQANMLKEQTLDAVLQEKNYQISKSQILKVQKFIDAGSKFALVEVSKRQKDVKRASLKPIQIAYESDNFALPIGLSADEGTGAKNTTLIILSAQNGAVPDTRPYRRLPNDLSLPLYIGESFQDSYKTILDHALVEDNFQSFIYEYSADMGACQHCSENAALSVNDYRELGAWWIDKPKTTKGKKPVSDLSDNQKRQLVLSRFHVRFTDKTISDSVFFKQLEAVNPIATTYKSHTPYLKDTNCQIGRIYKKKLPERYVAEMNNWSNISGAAIGDIKKKMEEAGQVFDIPLTQSDKLWWETMWDLPQK